MLLDRMNEDLKDAMRARDALRLSVLRMTLAEVKNARIKKGKDETLTDEEIMQVLRSAVKKREEAAAEYRPAGRVDLADKEDAEAAILKGYLPQMLEGEALRAAVAGVIQETQAQSMKDLGKVMKALMAAHPGKLDGKAAQAAIREQLGG
ncbi:MAG TPA: GatB/YqeY domain-containing protein [Candidatus Eisenbacteria bacterium]|nr:GatB/YqeY domain-containing protein [Candidatus Eisenbacteria bacterium]